MKKIALITLLLLVFSTSINAQAVECKTYTYALRGDTELRLDLYKTTPEVQPCLVYVFGGAFITGSRDSMGLSEVFEHFARCGWAVASIDYRLGLKPLVEHPELKPSLFDFRSMLIDAIGVATEDLLDATAYLVNNANELAINPEQIVVMGSSAGAITVCQAEWAICNGESVASVLPADFNYAGVISMAGAILGKGRNLRWDRTPCPMLLCHGKADKNVPYGRQSLLSVSLFGSEAILESLPKDAPYWFYDVCRRGHSISWRPMYEQRDMIESFLTRVAINKEHKQLLLRVDDPLLPKVKTNFGMMTYIKSNFGKRDAAELEIIMD